MSTSTLNPPARRPKQRVIPSFFVAILGIHAIACLAVLPYCFAWWCPILMAVAVCVFGTAGINLGYHRLLTHGSVKVPWWLERVLVLCGMCSLQGSPVRWVATHRMHHQHGDESDDPHTPLDGFVWAHMGWVVSADPRMDRLSTFERYVPDLLQVPLYRRLHRGITWVWVYLLHALLFGLAGFGLGYLAAGTEDGAWQTAAQVLVWGVFLRTVLVWHVTWLVNSASHRWGYQNYSTGDQSRNNWWVALLSNGEGWHNNHHASPRAAAHGHKWWEFDVTYLLIRSLMVVGLAKAVVPVSVPEYKKI